ELGGPDHRAAGWHDHCGHVDWSSVGNALFGQPGNQVTNLGAFSTGNGNFTLADGRALNITGLVNAGMGGVMLNASGTITEQSGGTISGGALTGSSIGNALFGQPGNLVTNLGAFSTDNGDFMLADGRALNITGLVNAGMGSVMLNASGTITEQSG